jgi:basic amino acid/polyamine antiporter, APA family
MADDKPSTQRIVRLDKNIFRRVLGIFDLFAIGYGDLGSSIYYALGITALYALGATPVALGLAGLVFVCTALTYAEMTSTFHESGGSASFARHAFNDLVSFIAGWGLLLDYIVTIAISAFAISPYLAYFFPHLKNIPIQLSFTVVLIIILLFLNIIGIRQSTRFSLVLMVLAVVTQLIIIAIGVGWLFDFSYITSHIHIGVPNVDWSPTWSEFWKGTAMAMVAYTGIESIAQLGSEAKKPARTVPKAVILTMVVLVVIYLGISVVALSALSPKDLGSKYVNDPLAGIVLALPFGSEVLAPWIGLLAAIILFVASNAGLVGASRLAYNLGEYYQLPIFFSRLHKKYRTPVISLVIFAVLASLVVIWGRGQLSFLADLYNFGAMIAFFSAHLSLIVLRVKQPGLFRPFKIPFNIRFGKYQIPITAIIGCLATMSVWFLVVITKREGRLLGLTWIGLGLIMYFIYRKRSKISSTAQVSIEKIKVPDYESINISNILVPTRGGAQTETVQMACEIAKTMGAKVTVVHIMEIPFSLPLDAQLPYRVSHGEAILKRSEAVARESHVEVQLKLLRSRSIVDSILDLLKTGEYDLLVMGAYRSRKEFAQKGLGSLTEKILKEAPCRVWVCASPPVLKNKNSP